MTASVVWKRSLDTIPIRSTIFWNEFQLGAIWCLHACNNIAIVGPGRSRFWPNRYPRAYRIESLTDASIFRRTFSKAKRGAQIVYGRGNAIAIESAPEPRVFWVTAENDLDDLFVYIDPLHERPDDLSFSLPVSACQLRSNGSRKLAKTASCKSKVFQLIEVACTCFNFGIKIRMRQASILSCLETSAHFSSLILVQ